MTKFEVIVLLVFYLKTNIITFSSGSMDTDIFLQTNDKVLKIIDDLLISLKTNKNFTKFKYAEKYTSRHTLIQEAIYNNHKKYKKVRDISKTKISNKIAYYISNINEVIEEMIRSEAVRNYGNNRNNINYTLEDEKVKDFVNLTKLFNLKLKSLASTITVTKLKGPKGNSQEEGRRIFAGSSTGIEQYPFMVSVHVAGRFVCAGSLLHESLALSAASCLMRTGDTKPDIQIRVASDFVSKMGSLVNIEELIFHPEFDRTSLENNIVLLRTKKALRFRKRLVVAIQYDRMGSSVLLPSVEDLVILGWGKRRTDGIDVPEDDRPLSEGHLQLYDFDSCQYIYTRNFVTDKSFCAGFVDHGAGACNHDAGGPALVNNVLVGVISFGSPHCGASEAPTVLTRLGLYAGWIEGVFRKLAESQGTKPEEQINISENILRGDATYLDHAMKDIYRENFNVDDVLYGPIETLYDGEMTNISAKSILREFPTDPNMFPNPKLVANLPSPKTLKPIEPPEGYWRDSYEETNPTNEDYKLPSDQFASESSNYSNLYLTTNQLLAVTKITDNVYAEDDENLTSIFTGAIREPVKANRKIKINPIFDSKELNKISKDKFREIHNNTVVYTRLFPVSSQNRFTYKPDKLEQPNKARINDKAVIVMADSGTTQIIEVNKMDPLYHRGFKMLADKIIRSNGAQT